MSFPTPWQVRHEVGFPLMVDDGDGNLVPKEDGLGNEIWGWRPPVPIYVIGWQPSWVESLSGSGGVQYTSRVVSDVDMAVPPTLSVSVRDRILLPGDDEPYEVVAIEDANHGFHGWQPGNVLKLKRVTG